MQTRLHSPSDISEEVGGGKGHRFGPRGWVIGFEPPNEIGGAIDVGADCGLLQASLTELGLELGEEIVEMNGPGR